MVSFPGKRKGTPVKLLIASDIHGSAYWCRALMKRIEVEKPDRIALLGDILYHGPRNDLPRDYAPKEVLAMLNPLAASLIAVRGNCDSEVDQMVLDFPCLADYALVYDGARQLFLTHGHVYGPGNVPPLAQGGVLLYGHTHVKEVAERDGVLFVNPGSVSLPKDGSNSYAVYEDGAFELRELTGE